MTTKTVSPKWQAARAARAARRLEDPRVQNRVEGHRRRESEERRAKVLAEAEARKADKKTTKRVKK